MHAVENEIDSPSNSRHIGSWSALLKGHYRRVWIICSEAARDVGNQVNYCASDTPEQPSSFGHFDILTTLAITFQNMISSKNNRGVDIKQHLYTLNY